MTVISDDVVSGSHCISMSVLRRNGTLAYARARARARARASICLHGAVKEKYIINTASSVLLS